MGLILKGWGGSLGCVGWPAMRREGGSEEGGLEVRKGARERESERGRSRGWEGGRSERGGAGW